MKGTFFLGNGTFETRSFLERPLRPGEVLVKIAACGICGTDVHIFHGGKGSASVIPPVILGHEFSGIVVAVGENCDRVAVGDHVAIDPNIYCGKCHYCQIGKKQMCTDLHALGVNMDGGFADYCYVPQMQCYQLSKDIPLWWGAMVEPLACCLHGIERAHIRLGETVCVIGGGAIGLLMVQLARLSGASRVVISEPIAARRKIALELGADAAVDPIHENLSVRLREILGSDGADVVIECVGNTIAVSQAMEAVDFGGTILLFSVPKPDSECPLKLEDIFQKELTIVGSKINPDTHGRAAQLISSGQIKIDPLITHTYAVEELRKGILKQMDSDSIKVIITADIAGKEL